MSDKGYKVWIQITLVHDDTSDIRYPVHLKAEYWWKCKLPFVPDTPLVLKSLGECPIQKLTLTNPVTYDVNDDAFICGAAWHHCESKDEFELKNSLLREMCKKKPF